MTLPAIILFDYAAFQAQIPQYSDPAQYPEELVQNYWNAAINYISDINFGVIHDESRRFAINLMVAHLIFIQALTAAGQVPALMQNATIDKISVGVTPPPIPNQWQWWLNLSPYGQQLLAQLQSQTAGGFFYRGVYPGLEGFQPGWNYLYRNW